MTINLQDLKSTFTLDTNPLQAGAKLAVAGVAALVAGIGIASKLTFDWANDLDSLGDVMDGTNDKFAAMAFIARKSGVGVDTVAKAGTLLNKSLLKANGTLDTAGKALKSYGINVKDANGNVKDSIQLTDEIGKKYSELATQQERVNFLTEIYGKAGAQMVDFFDTLAQEGGIDKVTQKVKEFGLAIDPARYEKFNRNLEELKLIGTGLAVQFTEKLMPAVEKFLGIITNPDLTSGEKMSRIFSEIDTFVGNMLNGFSTSIDDWVTGGGADRLTESLISWIDDVGKDNTSKSKIADAARRLVTSLGDAFKEVDWTAVKEAMGNRIQEMFDANRPRGQDAFADFWDALEVSGTDNMRNFWNNLEVKQTDRVRNFFNSLEKQGTEGTRRFVQSMSSAFTDTSPSFFGQMNNFEVTVSNKLREIAKTFFTRALAWTQQMIAGFQSGIGGLLSAIRGLVAQINGELRKIITSFTLSIKVPSLPNLSNLVGGGGSVGGHSGSGGGGTRKRASGGAVMAGQLYSVNEMGKPEYFLPHTSGQIKPAPSNQPSIAVFEDRQLRKLSRYIIQEGLKAA